MPYQKPLETASIHETNIDQNRILHIILCQANPTFDTLTSQMHEREIFHLEYKKTSPKCPVEGWLIF
jgi:hypothetical protein